MASRPGGIELAQAADTNTDLQGTAMALSQHANNGVTALTALFSRGEPNSKETQAALVLG